MVGEIIAVVVSIASAMLIYYMQRGQKRRDDAARARDEAADERADIRAKESALMLKMIAANNSMSYATAVAVRDQKVNGEMAAAMDEHKKAKLAYYNFVNEYAMEHINK